MSVRRFRRGDPLGGLPLGRALLLAAVVAVLLPLLVVITALTGFAAVERAHANAIGLLTAQQYQQDADLMYATIHGDVLESLEASEGIHDSGTELAAEPEATSPGSRRPGRLSASTPDVAHLGRAHPRRGC